MSGGYPVYSWLVTSTDKTTWCVQLASEVCGESVLRTESQFVILVWDLMQSLCSIRMELNFWGHLATIHCRIDCQVTGVFCVACWIWVNFFPPHICYQEHISVVRVWEKLSLLFFQYSQKGKILINLGEKSNYQRITFC